MSDLLIKNATIVNKGEQFNGSVTIDDGKIISVDRTNRNNKAKNTIDASGLILIPGVIDDQVHFRDPGLTHKGDLYSESRAAAAGGVTSYMEMPNTKPQTITQQTLADKYDKAEKNSLVNYSFYMGATNDNLDELLKTDRKTVCGIKIFMGSSTGNMLVDNKDTLRDIFSHADLPIAVHCEDENTIQANSKKYKQQYGDALPFSYHPIIRNTEACYKSSSFAVDLAAKHGTRLHILHLSTGKELDLFSVEQDRQKKQITSEVCVHHLWFNDSDYENLGARIKWNPAIKTESDQKALFNGLLEGKIDVVATDHAPHTIDEKSNSYFRTPSGGPLVQHSLVAMLEFYHRGSISLEQVVDKMCHAPADIFKVSKRGYIEEGNWADLVLIDLNNTWEVIPSNILYKCGWSPFEGQKFQSKVHTTIVNGNIVYANDTVVEGSTGKRLLFDRN
jgi:dihydroorotase